MPAWMSHKPALPVAVALLVLAAVLSPPPAAGQAGDTDAARRQLMEQRARELFPEYQRRKRIDGKSSADAWLKATAAEVGRRDGETLRRTQERQAAAGSAQRPASPTPAAGTSAPAQKAGRKCARTRVAQRMVPSMSGGAMQMIMVTECVPGT